ncbi:glucosaminidase domain-containing protein [Reinekea marinisedimentorum]|uniref:Bax protein n=1 Tax=Reinekea marinisedimentorum TaxID=230495 RepID=A0A4R3HY77_9GAMM|nr:glucosaminidase domain-containing protein [Reinekea marinisedimentorum]TCS37613.1 Bax protein [Reinekea marinisedimentorum]
MKLSLLNILVVAGLAVSPLQALANNSDSAEPVMAAETVELPEMAAIENVQEKKETFFAFLDPIVASVNERIQAERAWLKVVEQKFKRNEVLDYWQQSLLNELLAYYKVDEPAGSSASFAELYRKVDTIPASLVLAQAANESAWGTSRFAVEGNNLFGQWCFVKGCGLVPSGRATDASHEVRVFDSVTESVEGYFRNLNTHDQYASLRSIRAELRRLTIPLDSTYLAWGLEGYSSRGEHYIQELIDMIQFNRLQTYDQPAFYAFNGVSVQFD